MEVDPISKLKMTFSFEDDDSDQNYGPFQDIGLLRYQIDRLFPEFASYRSRIYNSTINFDADFATLLSSTSYIDKQNLYGRDFTPYDLTSIQAGITATLPANTGVGLLYRFPNTTFTQELRLVSPANRPFTWLAGVYYSDFHPQTGQDEITTSPLTDGLDIYTARDDFTQKEIAAFGEISYEVTSRLALTAGLRVFNFKTTDVATGSGLLAGGDSGSTTTSNQTSHSARYNATYKITDSNLIYVTAAQGYRAGGPTGTFDADCYADLRALGYATPPTQYKSDSLWNYELGSKNALFNNTVTINGDIYHIDWSNTQVAQNLPCGDQFIANAGRSKVNGAELEVTSSPVKGLELKLSGAYTRAIFADTNSQISTIAGADLPNVPRWTASGSAQYTFSVTSLINAYARADVQYVDSRLNDLAGKTYGLVREPAYEFENVRTGLLFNAWDVALFVNNLANKQAILDTTFSSYTYQSISTPRTIGVNCSYKF
jgi:outer membrane receptor protein involved in Fe transport